MSVPCAFLISHTESYRRHQTQCTATPDRKRERRKEIFLLLSSPFYFPLFSFLSCSEVKTFPYVATSVLWLMAERKTDPKCTYISHSLSLSRCVSKMLTNLDQSQDLPFSSFCGLREAIVAMEVMHILPCRNGKVVGVSWQRIRARGLPLTVRLNSI